jgi:hypothetical protein
LNKPQTEEARRSIRPAYHGVTAKLQHFRRLWSIESRGSYLGKGCKSDLGNPFLVNLFLGPTIYSVWNRKKRRLWIGLLNVALVICGGFPGWLVWIWALCGKREQAGPDKDAGIDLVKNVGRSPEW